MYANPTCNFYHYPFNEHSLEWNTTFPAITVCEIYNSEKIWELSETHNGADRDTSVDDLVADVAFFNGNCNSCRLCNMVPDAAAAANGADDQADSADDDDENEGDGGYVVLSGSDETAGDIGAENGGATMDCSTNVTDILDKYRTKCAAMLFNCTWNGQPLECCGAFLPMETEFGICFAINSMHTT